MLEYIVYIEYLAVDILYQFKVCERKYMGSFEGQEFRICYASNHASAIAIADSVAKFLTLFKNTR